MNVNKFYRNLLVAFGDNSGGATNFNTFTNKLVTAVANRVVKKTTIVALGGTAGGAANDTMVTVPAATAATTDTTAASLTSTNAAINIIKDDLQDLQAKVNALITAVG